VVRLRELLAQDALALEALRQLVLELASGGGRRSALDGEVLELALCMLLESITGGCSG